MTEGLPRVGSLFCFLYIGSMKYRLLEISTFLLFLSLNFKLYAMLFLFSPIFSLRYISNNFNSSKFFLAFFVIMFSISPAETLSSTKIAKSLSTAGYFGISTYFLLTLAYLVTFSKLISAIYTLSFIS